jgi:N-acetylneuraminic acid mutarotase
MNNDKAYVGLNSTGYFYEFDPQFDSWTYLGLFPGAPRRDAWSFGIDNIGYFGGGRFVYGSGNINDLWSFDYTSKSWTKKNNLPFSSTAGMAFTIQQEAYVLVGDNTTIKEFWKYNVIGDTWTLMPDLPFQATQYAMHFVSGNAFYISVEDRLWKFSGGSWTEIVTLPVTPSMGSVSFSLGGYAYLGMYSEQSIIYELNLTTLQIRRVLDNPRGPLKHTSVLILNSKAYCIGGQSEPYRILEYDPTYEP